MVDHAEVRATSVAGNGYTPRNSALTSRRPVNLSRLTAYAPGMATLSPYCPVRRIPPRT
ncbi:hypothetical protein [Kribbella sp. VKM Ac-2571]|uniref:hypothetical protein n=1 Tax=Kribbella sp. VKM Ac-2571 TaxID=2512222 RepID=UPI00192D7164|nr:hypothetical protein [Kribbella sp. VKM Ac-2571]